MEWTKNKYNEYVKGDGFFVSYNPNPNLNPTNALYNALGASVGIETKREETALVVPGGKPKWRILNGDFRKEYEEAIPLGLDACIAVYEENKAQHRSDWSTDEVNDESTTH